MTSTRTNRPHLNKGFGRKIGSRDGEGEVDHYKQMSDVAAEFLNYWGVHTGSQKFSCVGER